MNIHEYQGKAVLKNFGVTVSAGAAAFTVEEAITAAKSLPGPVYVVKSQIHAGGRGKANSRNCRRTPRAACVSRNRSMKSRLSPGKCWGARW
jgi:succinyl-CoA synthetase beta subunit